MNIKFNEKTYTYQNPTSLIDIKNDLGLKNILAASVNGRLRELSYIIDFDCEVEFLDFKSRDAVRIYESTLRYLVAMAMANIYPKAKLRFNYSISRSILTIVDHFDGAITEDVVRKISNEVQRLVDLDYPIIRKQLPIEEAKKTYERLDMSDKVAVLNYREENFVNAYFCKNYINYMFGYMLPRTSYVKSFNLLPYHPGFIIQYPKAESNGEISPFVDEPTFGLALREAAKWGKVIKGNTIPKINEYAKDRHQSVDFVNMCETKHFHQLNELGTLIQQNIESVRLIGIAGPSSSGKTTFSHRLRVELMSRGILPVMISIDDYYREKHLAPKNDDGSPDLEHLEALDVDQFNKDMVKLINGEAVVLPHFNFKTGKREVGKKVRVDENSPIIIEGIHALNDLLTKSIPKHQKFKIYISPQTQLHIDNHNPISITELRLLRRIVRDQKYRNTSAIQTLDMWASVRRGEFKWIYPNQNGADYVFNSELTYEFAVLKKHAIKSLSMIPRDNKHFITANRLLKFLKYFKDIDDDIVPCNSLLREFIGGSSFHE
jgi:uridine kinase